MQQKVLFSILTLTVQASNQTDRTYPVFCCCSLMPLCVFCFLHSPTMRWRSLYLSLLLLFFLLGQATASGFRICAYNLQKFNKTKASNYKVVNTLTRVTHTHTHKTRQLYQQSTIHTYSNLVLYRVNTENLKNIIFKNKTLKHQKNLGNMVLKFRI